MPANTFYMPGRQRAGSVNALFGAIAGKYDFINDLQSFGLHRLWKRQVVRLADAHPTDRALDVCCGTGDIAIAFVRHGTEAIGLDFNQEMLAVASRRKLKLAAHPSVGNASNTNAPLNFLCGDAMRLPFHDGSFDIVTVGYGLRNLANWESGLSEMQRVAKPGGRLLVLDFGKPDNRVWRAIYFGYLKLFVPVLGWIVAGNAAAYSYILESLKSYPAQHGVAAKMREAGLYDVRVINLLGGVMSIHYGEKPSTSSG